MKYFKRRIDEALLSWAKSTDRKPLLLRGARQVGKTSAVRHLGETFEKFVEIDLNERTDLHSLFAPQLSPQQICDGLSIATGEKITAGTTLLFLDEIQACPEAINKLRYFYEKFPELHLVATGSLLEFTLENLPSFGVGRIESLYMYPFSFEEFAGATNNNLLFDAIKTASFQNPLLPVIHEQAIDLLKIFLSIGGMPEVVAMYVKNKNLFDCQKVLNTLINSYKTDFVKYRKRIDPTLINDVWMSVAEQGHGKFVYSLVNRELRSETIRQALQTLVLAGLVYPVVHSSSNGLPLGAEVNRKYSRMIMLDTGIMQRLLNLNLTEFLLAKDFSTINKGALAEVFVGTELIKSAPFDSQAELYCWHREDKTGNAEIDYVTEFDGNVLPIEVKSGTRGSMQSLRLFLTQKKLTQGWRVSLENFSQYGDISVVPLYAIGCIMKTISNTKMNV